MPKMNDKKTTATENSQSREELAVLGATVESVKEMQRPPMETTLERRTRHGKKIYEKTTVRTGKFSSGRRLDSRTRRPLQVRRRRAVSIPPPRPREFSASTKADANLAECFRRERNFDAIDPAAACRRLDFVEAAESLGTFTDKSARNNPNAGNCSSPTPGTGPSAILFQAGLPKGRQGGKPEKIGRANPKTRIVSRGRRMSNEQSDGGNSWLRSPRHECFWPKLELPLPVSSSLPNSYNLL
jgi:hypothetical protein